MRIVRRIFNRWRIKSQYTRKARGETLLPDNLQEITGTHTTFAERELALKFWIRYTQMNDFSAEYQALLHKRNISRDSRLRSETPYLDEYQIMRVWGRLDQMEDSHDRKHPMILDGKSRLVRLLWCSTPMKKHCMEPSI